MARSGKSKRPNYLTRSRTRKAKMVVSSSTRILTKKESDRIAREEAYASEIPGLTHIMAVENSTKHKCPIDAMIRTEQNLPHILEDNSLATSIVDGQNVEKDGFGGSTDESATEDDEERE